MKRQRSRPSEWWAAAPSPVPPQGAAIKRTSRQTQDAPAAGNRGKILKRGESGDPSGTGKQVPTPGEEQSSSAQAEPNTEAGSGRRNQLKKRTTRRSNGLQDGAVVTTSNGEKAARQEEKAQLIVPQTEEGATSPNADDDPPSSKRKRGRPPVSQTKGTMGSEVRKGSRNVAANLGPSVEANKAQNKGRPSKSQSEETGASGSSIIPENEKRLTSRRSVEERVEPEKQIRRGRSSNNEAEIQSIFNEATRVRETTCDTYSQSIIYSNMSRFIGVLRRPWVQQMLRRKYPPTSPTKKIILAGTVRVDIPLRPEKLLLLLQMQRYCTQVVNAGQIQ